MREVAKTIVWIGLFVILLLCLSGVLLYSLDEYRNNEFRCHVNNELLEKGMTRAEVEQVLSQFGVYQSFESHFPGGSFRLRIVYKDPATYYHFGGDFILEFADYSFVGIWLPSGLGDSKAFCR